MNSESNSNLSKVILSLSYPIMAGMASRTLLTFMDTVMVGRLGAVAISAVGLGGNTIWIIISMLYSIGVGTQILVSRRYGENRFKDCGNVLNNAVLFSVIASIVLIIICFFGIDTIFQFFVEDSKVYQKGIPYIKIRIFEVFSFILIIVIAGFFNGIGFTKIQMYVMLVVSITNIILNYLLIFGKFGFPRLEVVGAAIASTSSTYLGLIIIILISLKRKYREEFSYFQNITIHKKIILNLLKLSYPNTLKNVLVSSGYLLFLKFVGIIGTIELAASTICLNITTIAWMPAVGIGIASTTLVGQSLGNKNSYLAEQYVNKSIKLSLVIMGSMGIIFIIFPQWIISIFTPDLEIIHKGVVVLKILGIIQFLDAIGIILSSSLEGAGKTFFVGVSEILMVWFVFVPLSYLFGVALDLGVGGSWIALIVYLLCFDIILFTSFKKGNWKVFKV